MCKSCEIFSWQVLSEKMQYLIELFNTLEFDSLSILFLDFNSKLIIIYINIFNYNNMSLILAQDER
jgi:hypothetical protein